MNQQTLFYYKPNFLNNKDLINLKYWLNNRNYISGENINNKEIPREQIWYQEQGKYFNSMWKQRFDRWKGNYYDIFLIHIQNKIQYEIETNDYLNSTLFKKYFNDNDKNKSNYIPTYPIMNSCLINKYRDSNDSISPHRDSPTSFGETPLIVILSIGHSRTLKLKKVIYDCNNPLSCKLDYDNNYMNRDFLLEDNSIFIMGGNSQKDYTHQIDKEKEKKGIRYSLTFRTFNNI